MPRAEYYLGPFEAEAPPYTAWQSALTDYNQAEKCLNRPGGELVNGPAPVPRAEPGHRNEVRSAVGDGEDAQASARPAARFTERSLVIEHVPHRAGGDQPPTAGADGAARRNQVRGRYSCAPLRMPGAAVRPVLAQCVRLEALK